MAHKCFAASLFLHLSYNRLCTILFTALMTYYGPYYACTHAYTVSTVLILCGSYCVGNFHIMIIVYYVKGMTS